MSTAAVNTDAASPTDANLAADTDYSLHLPASTVDDEIAKRKARAARFGTGDATATTAEDGEQQKALDRAKRFGLEPGSTGSMGKLDVALSTEGPKGRRRGPAKEGEDVDVAMDDPGLIRRGRGGRFRGRGRGRREGSAGARPTGVEKRSGGGWMVDKDRAAADARLKRFAQG